MTQLGESVAPDGPPFRVFIVEEHPDRAERIRTSLKRAVPDARVETGTDCPSGERATQSVKVPPTSIQNCQVGWSVIDILFAGAPDIKDPNCTVPRADLDCDEFSTALDLSIMIDHLFAGGDAPCDPCAK